MRDEELDRMIDAGLSTYAEPRAGLEQRVLASVAAEREQHASADRRPRWQMLTAGLAAAACVLIAITVGVRVAQAPQSHNQQAVSTRPAPLMNRPAAPEVRHGTPVRIAVTHRSVEARWPRLPKKAVFPTPQPLSPQMQALAQFVARAPEAQRRQLIEAQAKLDAPITIAPLKIAPLEIAEMDGN